jgi:hypothetical protein
MTNHEPMFHCARRFFTAALILTAFGCGTPAPGPQGERGDTGASGTPGMSGAPGAAGSDGAQGAAGTNGKSALLRIRAEAAGANCAAGGTAVLTGLDANSDGMLNDNEVTSTSYLCGMAVGLVRTDAEPVGPNCALGGTVVSSGKDTNGNGTLDVGEIIDRRYVCGADASGLFVEGDVTILNSVDYDRFKNSRRISGVLTLNSNRYTGTAIEFSQLESVGALTLSNLQLVTSISFPQLTRTTLSNSSSITGNPLLTTIHLPRLATVLSSLNISNNGNSSLEVSNYSLPALQYLVGSLTIQNNRYLNDCPIRSTRRALAEGGSPSASLNVSSNGSLLSTLDGGFDAGVCDSKGSCWVATPGSTLPRALDGGLLPLPAWAADGGAQTTTLAFCGELNLDFATGAAECATVLDGGRLASFETQQKNEVFVTRANQYFGNGWVLASSGWDERPDGGLTVPDAGWRWGEGAEFTFTNWLGGEPNSRNNNGNEHCVQLNQTGWNDIPCTVTHPVACEAP